MKSVKKQRQRVRIYDPPAIKMIIEKDLKPIKGKLKQNSCSIIQETNSNSSGNQETKRFTAEK